MEFTPNNPIVQLCLQGMNREDNAKPDEAKEFFLKAWEEAGNDFEKFLAAFYVARHQETGSDRLQWLERALHHVLNVDGEHARSALPSLYANMAKGYEDLGDQDKAKIYTERSLSSAGAPSDKGPFFHGTRADLKVGDMLTPGNRSNYQEALIMNHIYFTALPNGAGLAAALAKGEGKERVYIVEPTGAFENDPNVTDKKFPGNPTRSYRTPAPLKIIGEVSDWNKISQEERRKWQEKLNNSKGTIIN